MNILKLRLKRNALRNIVKINNTLKSSIQPFKELPSINSIGQEARINAHDLFSFYTADIIKEDIVFVR